MTKSSTEKHGDLTLRSEVVHGRETGRWFIDIPARISSSGKRQRLRFPSKTAARDNARRMVKLHRLNVALSAAGHTGFTLLDVLPRWIGREKMKIAAGKKKKSSLVTDLHALRHLEAFFGGYDLADITTDCITAYQAHRVEAGIKPVTINTECRKLTSVLSWCRDQDLLRRVPKVEPLEERTPPPEIPNVLEMERIIVELEPHTRTLFRLMAETGLRVGEAKKLRWTQVDLVNRSIDISEDGDWTPKTRHSYRTVYFGESLGHELRRLERASEWLFPSLRDPDKHVVDFRDELQAAIVRSGVQRKGRPIRITPKTAQKWFTTYQTLGTGNLPLVKRQIGHSPNSRVTEAHYIHIPEYELQAATMEVTLRSRADWLGQRESIWQPMATQEEAGPKAET